MVSPFLLREVLDVAIPEKDRELLAWLVGGMIAISVATGVLGVGQTWLSNLVGQRVMHDLRTQVYRHLQRLSLAFFTRTRTGEIQSRIANDIGGVQTVVTTTATSIVSNVTTVVASVVAMFLLDWRLALFSLGLTPFFVLLARRVGNQRKKITTVKQGAMADISSLVQESLSVSGILLGKTMGRGAELADRFEGESARLADLEVRSRMAGRWMMASIQTSFAVMPALVYLFAGLSPERGLDRHRGRLHDAADAAVLAAAVRCSTSAWTSRPRPRCSTACSSTSTCRSTSTPARASCTACAARSRFDDVWFALRTPTSRDAARDRPRRAGGHAHRARRRDRLGQDDARLPRRAALRPRPRRRAPRRRAACAS